MSKGKRVLLWAGVLAALIGVGLLGVWVQSPPRYNEELVERLGQCQTLDALRHILGQGTRDETIAGDDVAVYYWLLSSNDSHVTWAVLAIANKNDELTQIAYIPRRREPSLLQRLLCRLGL
jgi:hypothetical protein